MISRSRPGCPWENGHQESFYDKFKVDLGDPNRFKTLGELVAEIYRTVWDYNNKSDPLGSTFSAHDIACARMMFKGSILGLISILHVPTLRYLFLAVIAE